MRTRWLALLLPLTALVVGACNNVGDCPAPSAITPGGSCSGDNLECPFTLQSPSMACDGTMAEGGIATSCVCQDGSWSCPSPFSCGSDGGEDAEATDAAITEAGGDGESAAAPDANEASSGGQSEASTDATGQ